MKFINLTGQKFGRLTVIRRAENKNGRTMWECLCSCGNTTVVAGSKLKNGHTKSCGCLGKENFHRKILDLTGNKIGELVVVERDFSKTNGIYWLCKCSCGNMVSLSRERLRSGQVVSCGCVKKKRTQPSNFNNLLGQRFGKLIVIERAENNKYGRARWKCKCDCGNETVVHAECLRSGSTTSCGCSINRPCGVSPTYEGRRFGRLLVLKKVSSRRYKCKCDCGNFTEVRIDHLLNGSISSCGCFLREATSKKFTTHGHHSERIYSTWAKMKARCSNPNDTSYDRYGALGIKVTPEWFNDFMPFYDWAMSHGYRDDLTIDRINPWKGYEPSNCRWIPLSEQSSTRRACFKDEKEAEALRKRIMGEDE